MFMDISDARLMAPMTRTRGGSRLSREPALAELKSLLELGSVGFPSTRGLGALGIVNPGDFAAVDSLVGSGGDHRSAKTQGGWNSAQAWLGRVAPRGY